MFFFIFGSLLTVFHYRTDPPSVYSWEVNITIAGEGFLTLLLAGIIFYCRKQTNNLKIYQQLSQDEQHENLIHENPFAKELTRHRSPQRIN